MNCRTNILTPLRNLCNNDPTAWVEWGDREDNRSREEMPICDACAVHLKAFAVRKGLTAFLHLVPLTDEEKKT